MLNKGSNLTAASADLSNLLANLHVYLGILLSNFDNSDDIIAIERLPSVELSNVFSKPIDAIIEDSDKASDIIASGDIVSLAGYCVYVKHRGNSAQDIEAAIAVLKILAYMAQNNPDSINHALFENEDDHSCSLDFSPIAFIIASAGRNINLTTIIALLFKNIALTAALGYHNSPNPKDYLHGEETIITNALMLGKDEELAILLDENSQTKSIDITKALLDINTEIRLGFVPANDRENSIALIEPDSEKGQKAIEELRLQENRPYYRMSILEIAIKCNKVAPIISLLDRNSKINANILFAALCSATSEDAPQSAYMLYKHPNFERKNGLNFISYIAYYREDIATNIMKIYGEQAAKQNKVSFLQLLDRAVDPCSKKLLRDIMGIIAENDDPNAEAVKDDYEVDKERRMRAILQQNKAIIAACPGVLDLRLTKSAFSEVEFSCLLVEATKRRDQLALELLLEYGADIDATDTSHNNAFHTSIQRDLKTALYLLQQGANIHALTLERSTILAMVIKTNTDEIKTNTDESYIIERIDFLLKHGFDINAADKDGVTPLHIAAQQGYDKVVRRLLEHGADINPKDDQSRTPLHYATINNRENVVETLLKNEADDSIEDIQHESPYDYALGAYSLYSESSLLNCFIQNRRNIQSRHKEEKSSDSSRGFGEKIIDEKLKNKNFKDECLMM